MGAEDDDEMGGFVDPLPNPIAIVRKLDSTYIDTKYQSSEVGVVGSTGAVGTSRCQSAEVVEVSALKGPATCGLKSVECQRVTVLEEKSMFGDLVSWGGT